MSTPEFQNLETPQTMRDRADIPNQDGFQFLAVFKDGEKRRAFVQQTVKGNHVFRCGGRSFSGCVGWLPLEGCKQ